jgi:PKD repeat protein
LTAACLPGGEALADCNGCLNPSFGTGIRAYRAPNPLDLAFADLNDDGFDDLVSVPGDPGPLGEPTIAVFLASGAGSLLPVSNQSLPEVSSAKEVATADFNGDGFLDIAALAASGESVSILPGLGNGTFAPATSVPVTPPLYGSLTAADFNGDGIPDLAATSGSLVVLLGHGDGTFEPPSEVSGTQATSFVVADFNDDGVMDLASGALAGIAVSFGNGNGTFRLPVITTPAAFGLTVTGDFDRDGKQDLASTNGDGDLIVYLGRGDGTFTRTAGYLIDVYPPRSILSDDLNADGLTDIVVTAQYGVLALFQGRGDGTFHSINPNQTAFQPGTMAAGDLDRDGFRELAVATEFRSFLIYRSEASGFVFPNVFLGGYFPNAIATADFSGDAVPDIALSVSTVADRSIQTLEGNGDGTFQIVPGATLEYVPLSLTATDFNADDKADLVAGTTDGLTTLAGNGHSTFEAENIPGSEPSDVVVGDFNGDAHIDIVTSSNSAGQISLYLGDGAGSFAPQINYPLNGPLAVGDFDGNAHDEIVVSQYDKVQILVVDNDGDISAGATIPVVPFAGPIAVADFTEDGKPDVVVTSEASMSVFPGLGDGTFAAGIESPGFSADVRIADLNGDGHLDLTAGAGYFVTLFLGDGDGGLREDSSFFHTVFGYAVTDLNDDSHPDLILLGAYRVFAPFGTVSVLLSSQCQARRLVVTREPPSCAVPGEAFAVQPEVKVYDDGDNVIACDTGEVTASLVSGTGTAGAVLEGSTSVAAVAGVAAFTDLAIDQPGAGYRLQFSHPVAGVTRSRSLSQGLSVLVNGPTLSCDGFPPTYRTGSGGYDRYLWELDGVEVSQAAMPTLAALSPGDHTLEVTVFQDGCTATDTRTISVSSAPPPPSIGAPLWSSPAATGLSASVQPHPGNAYVWSLSGGTITAGQGTAQVTFDAGTAGTTMVLRALEVSAAGCESSEESVRIQVDFADVPASHPFHDAVSSIARNGISRGCGGGRFCPDDILTRAQMAVFLLRAEHGGSYQPPALGGFGGTMFADVGADDFAATFIQQLGVEKITSGCGGGNYCPDDPVTRAQMSIFLLRVEHGFDYQPPDATGLVFLDVQPADFAARFIEQIAREGISGGCGNGNFCPDDSVSRAQMAAFLRRTFNLP